MSQCLSVCVCGFDGHHFQGFLHCVINLPTLSLFDCDLVCVVILQDSKKHVNKKILFDSDEEMEMLEEIKQAEKSDDRVSCSGSDLDMAVNKKVKVCERLNLG